MDVVTGFDVGTCGGHSRETWCGNMTWGGHVLWAVMGFRGGAAIVKWPQDTWHPGECKRPVSGTPTVPVTVL